MGGDGENETLKYLLELRQDIRDEVKRRIEQRDKYSVQMTIALGAIFAFSFSNSGFRGVLLTAPLVAIYFTALILYSYRIHTSLTLYLRREIEPQVARLTKTTYRTGWEHYYRTFAHQVPGVRGLFFLITMWFMCLLAPAYMYIEVGRAEQPDPEVAQTPSEPSPNSAAAANAEASSETLPTPQMSGDTSGPLGVNRRLVLGLGAFYIFLALIVTWSRYGQPWPPWKRRTRDWPRRVQRYHGRAVFLDRDGTLNHDTGYIHKVEDLKFVPGALRGMASLAKLPLDILVVSNQGGIALKKFKRKQMSTFNAVLRARIERAEGRIDAFYYCRHKEEKDLPEGARGCSCSKPKPGMLFDAAKDYALDLADSFLIGDRATDIQAGNAARCTTILLRADSAAGEALTDEAKPDHVVGNLVEAAALLEGLILPREPEEESLESLPHHLARAAE